MTTIHMPSHAMRDAIETSNLTVSTYISGPSSKTVDEPYVVVSASAALVRRAVHPTTTIADAYEIIRAAMTAGRATIGGVVTQAAYAEFIQRCEQDLMDGCSPLLVLERIFTCVATYGTKHSSNLRHKIAGRVCCDTIARCLPGGVFMDIQACQPRYPEWVVD